jgi:DNA repair exonuclease SbcCD ATPase subunit
MIIFESVKWKNLLSTGNSFTKIDITKNKNTLMIGSNGAGKSTILDALCFGLYNKPFRKIPKGHLVNMINQKNLEVEIEFRVGKRNYRIVRGIKPNKFEIYLDDNLIDQNADAKEYQEYLEKNILKLNHKSFCQIVVLGSANFQPFMQLSVTNRRQIIEDLLDIQIFSLMNNILKTKLSDNKLELNEASFNIRNNADKITMLKEHLEKLKQNNEDLIKQKEDKIDEYRKQIATNNKTIKDLTVDLKAKLDSISDGEKLKLKDKEVWKSIQTLSAKKSQIESEIEFFTDHNDCPTCKQGIDHEHKQSIVSKDNEKIEEITEIEKKLDDTHDKIAARFKEINAIKVKIDELNKTISNCTVQIETYNNFITDLTTEITKIKKDSKDGEDNSEELKKYKNDLKKAIENKETLAKDKQLLDIAVHILRDSGIKTKIIKQYVPVMNKLINKYLAALDFFVNFNLNENFEETIKSRHRDNFVYENFSQGEKLRIDLALLFTWRAIAKLRNSANTNLLIMDEILDSSLDMDGTDEFLKLIQQLTEETNVFIISHKGDQLFEKFDNVMRFEKYKNFSRMIV